MRRIFLPCFVAFSLLASADLRAGDWSDVPLSHRSIAPIPGIFSVFGVAGEGAILTVFSTTEKTWIQRVSPDGERLDPMARPVPGQVWAASREGDGWLLAVGYPVALMRIGADGVPRESRHQSVLRGLMRLIETSEGMLLTTFYPLRTYRVTLDLELELVHEASVHGGLLDASPLVLDRGVGTARVVSVYTPGGPYTIRFLHSPAGPDEPTPGTHEITVTADWGVGAFVPSPDGGGLFIWGDAGVRGMVLRRDGTLGPPQLLMPSTMMIGSLQGVASEEGWTVGVHGREGIEVGKDGLPLRRFALPEGSSHVVLPGVDVALKPLSAGFSILLESTEGWLPRGMGGSSLAAQGHVRVADHGAMTLAVWPETSFEGAVLRATRLIDGTPLDGAGIVVSEESVTPFDPAADPSHDVIWDGEAFLVAWTEGEDRRLVVRRVMENGSILPATTIAERSHDVRLASDGQGSAMALWTANESPIRVQVAPIDRGTPGPVVSLFERRSPSSIPGRAALAWTGTSYVAVWDEAYTCRVLCPYIGDVFARAVSRDGLPMGDEVRATRTADHATEGQVLQYEGRMFALLQYGHPGGLSELWSNLTLAPPVETPFAERSFSRLRLGEREFFVDADAIRTVYSAPDRRLLRLEPLPVAPGEAVSAQAGPRFIVSTAADAARSLVIRTAESSRRADVAVTGLDTRWLFGTQVVRFLVENRGPDPVAVTSLLSRDRMFLGDDFDQLPILPMELPVGSSIEISVSSYGTPRLCAAGDAEDLVPGNNCASPERKRAVRRGAH